MIIKSAYRICPADGHEPDYRELIPDAGLRRRMSRIVRMGVASALECLRPFPGLVPDAVITATALGPLADTEKFLGEMTAREESLLNPAPFIYSTFNTVAGQIALIKGIKSYNMTYVNGGESFRDAMLDAALCISEGRKDILVVYYDEVTPFAGTVMDMMGCRHIDDAVAVSFLLSGDTESAESGISGYRLDIQADRRDIRTNAVSADSLYMEYLRTRI